MRQMFTRSRIVLVGCLTALASAMLVGPALAQGETDPLGGAGTAFFGDILDYFKEHVVVGVIGLAVAGIVLGLLIKGGKKAKAAA